MKVKIHIINISNCTLKIVTFFRGRNDECEYTNNIGLAWTRPGLDYARPYLHGRDFVDCHLPWAFVFLHHLHGHITPIIGQASIKIVQIVQDTLPYFSQCHFAVFNTANSRRKREWISFSRCFVTHSRLRRSKFADSPRIYLRCR